jgi:hypothetical protein
MVSCGILDYLHGDGVLVFGFGASTRTWDTLGGTVLVSFWGKNEQCSAF